MLLSPLKHSLFVEGDDEVILFVCSPQRAVKDYLDKHGSGGVTRVMELSKLKKRFGTHEARRHLMRSYDYFLVDSRISPMMPNLLGTAFVSSKRMPMAVNMSRDVVAGIKRALASTAFCPRMGTSCSVKVGRFTGFSEQQVTENIETVLGGIVGKLEGGWSSIQSIHLKSNRSPGLPLYNSLPTVLNDKRERAEGADEQPSKKRKVKVLGKGAGAEEAVVKVGKSDDTGKSSPKDAGVAGG